MKHGIADSVRHHNDRAKRVRHTLDNGARSGWGDPRDGTVDHDVFIQALALWRSMSSRSDVDDKMSQLEGTYGLLQLERMILGNPTTWISPEIMTLLDYGASIMEPEPIRYDDLIADKGFIMFGKPLKFEDERFVTGSVGWCGVGWKVTEVTNMDGTKSSGLSLMIYTNGELLKQAVDRVMESHEDGEKETMIERLAGQGQSLYIMDFHAWSFTQKWTDEEHEAPEGFLVATPDVAYMRKFFLSLMRFCWQEILVRKPVGSEFSRLERRAVEREASKAKWDGQVTTLRLRRQRRAGHEDGTGTGTGLDHQIFVRGYWRRQWYKELGEQADPEARRMTFVSPHIKGPDHAPLVIKHQVTAVVR